MLNRRVTIVALAGGVIAAAVVLVLATGLLGASESRSTLDRFLEAWRGERYQAAGELTDADPNEVADDLAANREGLDGAGLETEVEDLEESGERAKATVAMRWDVPVIGGFEYRTDVELVSGAGGSWKVHWTPGVIHPELEGSERLGTEREFPQRAPILDREGRKLTRPRPVIDVGVVPARLEDRDAAVERIADLTEANADTLRRAIRGATPRQFVSAITLREEDFGAVEDELRAVEGVVFSESRLSLAPSREFARALLGTVGPITEEQLEELGDPYGIGDQVGQWGLQARFERRLAGEPTRRVVVRNAAGVPVKTLTELDGKAGEPLKTTIDLELQNTAEGALRGMDGNAALVAIQPSSGDLLAVANRPVEEVFNRALEGQYPPGSTFKVVTTAALLEGGLDPSETVACPARIEVGGRQFQNFEGGALGPVPFSEDFAQSCNAAFVSLADRLEADALADTAALFGVGERYELAVETFPGDVPPADDIVERAEQMIGQGEILASPLALAGVAGTVAEGRWHQPRLLGSDQRRAGPELDPGLVDELRGLMRAVVTSGTGTALADVPGEVAGKSGTAEYAAGDPPPTHAWFIAFTEDLAVAVLVEDAPSGGEAAAPVVAEFLSQLP